MDTFFTVRFSPQLSPLLIFLAVFSGALRAAEPKRPSWETIQAAAAEQLTELGAHHVPLMRSHAKAALEAVKRAGWSVPDQDELLNRVLADDAFLVRELHSPQGQRFLKALPGEHTLLDRLDRISRESGGERMIHDLLRLPDGSRYAKARPTRGAPDLVDLLPKNASGKRRHIKDYDRPTGRFYTADAFLKELEKVYTDSSGK